MLLSKRTELYLLFQATILIALYVIYIVGGYKTYNVWSQVETLAGHNPFRVIGHPHGLRYMIASPAIFIAEYFDWNKDTVFGLFVTTNLAICAFVSAYIQSIVSAKIEKRWSVWLLLFIPIFLTLSFAMNGRLSYMLLGTSLLMFSYMRWSLLLVQKRPLWNILPYVLLYSLTLTLLSVSSGCFTVGMIVAILQTFVLVVIADRPSDKVGSVILNSFAPIALAFLQYTFVEKNLSYYDGSVFAMLTHGPGQYLIILNPNKYIIAAIFAAAAFFMVLFSQYTTFFIRKNILLITPLLLVGVSLAIGLFGYSALLTGSIAAMILTLHIGGILFYSNRSPAAHFKEFWSNSTPHIGFTASRKVSAATAALAVGIVISTTFPDDWTIYAQNKIKEPLNPITYSWHNKETSYISGNFVPSAMTTDQHGNMYIVESHKRILRMTPSGKIERFAGGGGTIDKGAHRLDVYFNFINDIAVDKSGNLYVADSKSLKIKKIDTNGIVSTAAGSGRRGAFMDGCKAHECRLNDPRAIRILPNNELLIADGIYLIRLLADGTMRLTISMGEATGKKREKE